MLPLSLRAPPRPPLKRTSAGAGLGGGSGNAATTLYAANKLMGEPATNEELLAWSGEIGSDISVFFSEGKHSTASCGGWSLGLWVVHYSAASSRHSAHRLCSP